MPEGWRAGARAGGNGAADELPLFVTQGALREVFRHLRSDPEQELLGFLLGNLFEDSEAGVQFLVITGALRTSHAIGESDQTQIPEEQWLGMQLELRRRRAVLVGWYHSTPFVGPHPVRIDLETHRERFPEPWQTGLVVATGGDAPTGGFFRPSPGDPTGGVYIPFHELADDESLLPGGRKRSLIDWANYHTDDPVEIDRAERRPHIAPRRPTAERVAMPPAGPSAAAPEPGAASATAAAPVPTLPVMIPPIPEPGEEAPEYRERRLVSPTVGVLIVLALVAGGGYWMVRHHGVEPPPNASTDLLPRSFPSASDTVPAAAAADTTGLGAPGGSMSAGPPSTPVVSAAPASPAPRVVPPSVPATPQIARFDSLADSTEQTIRNFHDRRTDFRLQRLTCHGLGVGYRAADDAFIALATHYRGVRDALDATRDARYRTITAAMDTVNNEFDSSKCERP